MGLRTASSEGRGTGRSTGKKCHATLDLRASSGFVQKEGKKKRGKGSCLKREGGLLFATDERALLKGGNRREKGDRDRHLQKGWVDIQTLRSRSQETMGGREKTKSPRKKGLIAAAGEALRSPRKGKP